MAETEGMLSEPPPSSPAETFHTEATAECPICGHGHSSDLDRFEHWLLEGGGLRRATELDVKGVPLTRPGIWIPGNPLPISTVSRTLRRTRKILSDLGYVERKPRGRWATISGRNPIRRISIPEVKEYVDRLYPPRCQRACSGKMCKCCRLHHIGSWNKIVDAFHRLGQYFRYGKTFRDEPSWSHEKLLQLYNVTPTLQYRVPPPTMNAVPKAVAFREWLIHHEDVQKQLYGWMIWFGQALGLRYSEWIAAEWPMEGPRFRVDLAAGKVNVTGKGRLGGKMRSVTITPDRARGLRALTAWRSSLGDSLTAEGFDLDQVLFLNLEPRHLRGKARSPDVGAWNHTVRKYVGAYNRDCRASGREDLTLDPALVSSHKIGRPVHITTLALAKVDDKVAMEETGIEDERTLARYKRFSDRERFEMIERADLISAGATHRVHETDPPDRNDLFADRLAAVNPKSGPALRLIIEALRALEYTDDHALTRWPHRDRKFEN